MIVYADSSSILSFHLTEFGRHLVVRSAFDLADRIATSLIALPEVRSGLARARFKSNPTRLSQAEYQRVLRDFTRDWPSYSRVNASPALVRKAGDLAEAHLLRGYDAVHLASALALSASLPGEVYVSTWDRELAEAALSEGLPLAHEVTT